MKLFVKSASPDGMIIKIELFIDTWEELKKLIDIIARIESGNFE
jgi:hypothetical protein